MSNPRAEFSSIFDRKPLKLPGGARVAIWPVINVEEWDINEPMPAPCYRHPKGCRSFLTFPTLVGSTMVYVWAFGG